MGRISEKPFFHSRHIDGQQAHEKMLSITNHQGNENQNYKKISPHTYQNVCHKTEVTSVGEDVEKREPSYTVDGNVNWYSHYGKQYRGSSKS